jgi:hypothetical protein
LCSKNVPKYVQFGLAVPEITLCSLAFRSILASASRIMVSFAWLYRLIDTGDARIRFRVRDERLNGEVFYSLRDVQVVSLACQDVRFL